MATFGVTIDVASITGLAGRLSKLTAEEIGAVTVKAVNETTDVVYKMARTRMTETLSLTDDYIKRKMVVTPATTAKPEASIAAFGRRNLMTGLSHYGAMQEHEDADHPGRSKGDRKRGIPAGQKAAGMSVEVTRGKRKLIEHAFTMPGKKDNSGNLLVFTRSRNNKIRARTGPSVYQLFRSAARHVEPDAEKKLRDNLVNMVEAAITRTIA
jgi:hypothetical protein